MNAQNTIETMPNEMQLRDVEGVQFFTDRDGNAGMSQRGLAKLCGVDAHAVRRFLDREDLNSQNTVETVTDSVTGVMTANVSITTSSTCVAAIKYFAFESKAANETAKTAFFKFAEIGFTKWVQTITGFEPSQPVTAHKELTALEVAKAYVALLEEKAEVIAYLGDKPGLAHKMAQAHQGSTLPCEKLSFDEMCDLRGIRRYDVSVKRELSRKLANSVSNDNLVEVGTKTITTPGLKKPQYYAVKAYSVESLPHFDNVVSNYTGSLK